MPPTPRSPRLSRRALLGGFVAVSALPLAGCTTSDREGPPDAPAEPEADPDVTIAMEALAGQRAVIALITATRERHPGLGDRLAPVLSAHEAHAGLLEDAVPPEARPQEEASPTGSATASPATPSSAPTALPGTPGVPANARRAVRAVAAAERELVTATQQHAFRARSGAFARVLGSMAAAAAQHAAVLGGPEGLT